MIKTLIFLKIVRLTEAVYTKTEMNNVWNVNFLENSSLGILLISLCFP